jgi:predicted amidohydrolase
MIVAGIQLDIAWEDPDENFRRVGPLVAEAADGGARLIALPEMFATGFSMRSQEMAGHAEATRRFLADLATRSRTWLVAGLAEPGRTRPANACVIYGPTGSESLHYRKIHPFTLAGEPEHYEPGEDLRTVEIDGLRVTPLICYDLRFPELFRTAALRTDLFVVIANWPERRAHAWRTLLAARAIDCQAYVLGVNRVGEGDGHPYRGDSTLFDPWGANLATLGRDEGVVRGEVDAAVVATARERFSFLADRRPEVYQRLEEGRDRRKGERGKGRKGDSSRRPGTR